MRVFAGEEKLKKQTETRFPKGITKITDGVYFALGYGGSTCTLIEGEERCILVDTLNGVAVAQEAKAEFEKITSKPIRHIIYTHYHHFDHTSGAGIFADADTEIIGHRAPYPQYGRSGFLKKAYALRGSRQFGPGLTPEEQISVGIGPRNNNNGEKQSLPPNRLFDEKELELNLEGVQLLLVEAPGETDDQIFIYLPEKKVLLCGDNYYESWPNLYAIRGGQYRDISSWVDALDKMRALHAEYLLPGHTQAVIGAANVEETLTNYRDAILYVLEETLKGMSEGKTMDQLAVDVRLPQKWAELPYLQEYYGTVEWTVRSIYTGYLGWFDGNPTRLGTMHPEEKGSRMLAMMGGAEKVLAEIDRAIEQEEDQWAAELCDILLDAGAEIELAREKKAECLMNLGRMQTSANGRHYYISCAKELRGIGKTVMMTGAAADVDKKGM